MVLIKDMPPAHLCSQTALYHDMCEGHSAWGALCLGLAHFAMCLANKLTCCGAPKKNPTFLFASVSYLFLLFFFFFSLANLKDFPTIPVFVAIQALPTHSLFLEPQGCATTTALNHTRSQKGLTVAHPSPVLTEVTAAAAAPLGLLQGRKTSRTQRQLWVDEFSHPHGYTLLCFYTNRRMCFREKIHFVLSHALQRSLVCKRSPAIGPLLVCKMGFFWKHTLISTIV